MITRREILAMTIVSAGLSVVPIRQLAAKASVRPTHHPSAGFGRKLWIALGDGKEIEFFGRQPVTFHVNDRQMISNDSPIYFRESGPDDRYEISTFHLFDNLRELLFEGTFDVSLRTFQFVIPEFATGALEFDLRGIAHG